MYKVGDRVHNKATDDVGVIIDYPIENLRDRFIGIDWRNNGKCWYLRGEINSKWLKFYRGLPMSNVRWRIGLRVENQSNFNSGVIIKLYPSSVMIKWDPGCVRSTSRYSIAYCNRKLVAERPPRPEVRKRVTNIKLDDSNDW